MLPPKLWDIQLTSNQLPDIFQCRLLHHAHSIPDHLDLCATESVALRIGTGLGHDNWPHCNDTQRKASLRLAVLPGPLREQCVAWHDDPIEYVSQTGAVVFLTFQFYLEDYVARPEIGLTRFHSALVHSDRTGKAHGVLPFLPGHGEHDVWGTAGRHH